MGINKEYDRFEDIMTDFDGDLKKIAEFIDDCPDMVSAEVKRDVVNAILEEGQKQMDQAIMEKKQ